MTPKLPIDSVIPEILHLIRNGAGVVLEAPPGAGKTTRVPPAILSAIPGEVWVLEPRRLAARMAARRVAEELGEKLGESVGYQVRFEDVSGPRTRLRFLTEGVFTRRLLSNPELRRVDCVILDEFHERHLDGDLALALVRRLQLTSRRDLRIVVMSATLGASRIGDYLQCEVVRSEGRLFNVEVAYRGYSAAQLEEQVAAAVEDCVKAGLNGDVLVFLPGAAEIRRCQRACEPIARRAGLAMHPLHGDLSSEEQDRAVGPSDHPKLILSTNVAESSITIEGVTVVIDSGLARVAVDSPLTGLPTLNVQRISQASAIQRAGRAGRTRPGRVIRLYSSEDLYRRPEHDVPEIHRRELSQVLLDLHATGTHEVSWFEPPPPAAVSAARDLLERLHAFDEASQLARYPVHPRLARLLTDAAPSGALDGGVAVAALLSSGERHKHIDLLQAIDEPPGFRTEQIARQLRRMMPRTREKAGQPSDADLQKAVLRAYPDRVGRKRVSSSKDTNALMCSGKSASIDEQWRHEFFVAVEIEDRREQAAPLIRLACAIEPEWLLDLFPERIRELNEVLWNAAAERVENRSALLYDELIIEESRGSAPDPQKASELLARKAVDEGLPKFVDAEELEEFLARVAFASEHSAIQSPASEDVEHAIAQACIGMKSFAELRAALSGGGLIKILQRNLGSEGRRTLEEIAPERLTIKNRPVKVHYVRGQTPWIASRLQDFFGLRQSPSIARGKVPVLIHLLAPNQRPVQTTTDLAGFWERLYPQVRKELSRRYPKHSWPEKPV
jgi:ATP-dependent helicase HrpB